MQPVISGSKDWGAYEISGLAIDSIEILPENVQVLPRLQLDLSALHLQTPNADHFHLPGGHRGGR